MAIMASTRLPATMTSLVSVPPIIFVSFLLLQPLILIWLALRILSWHLRSSNPARRKALLHELGYATDDDKRIVGFFHPYW